VNNPNPLPPAASTTPPIVYKTLDDIELGGSVRGLLYGPPKIGKTALVCTFPGVAVADFDGEGVKVAKTQWFKDKFGVRRVVHEQFILEHDDWGMPTEKTMDVFKSAIRWMNHVLADNEIQTISVDSLTTLSRAASVVGMIANSKSSDKGRSQTWKNRAQTHVLLMTQADFGAEMNVVEQLMDQIVKVKHKHVVVTAHEREEKTDSGITIAKSPLITGDRLRAKIAAWFDDVWYLESDAMGRRTLITKPKALIKSVGSRYAIPDIPDPDFTKIHAAITKGGK
jgi:hypothetical protein